MIFEKRNIGMTAKISSGLTLECVQTISGDENSWQYWFLIKTDDSRSLGSIYYIEGLEGRIPQSITEQEINLLMLKEFL